jgi:4-hydroxybenzoate polyprenyltransferase
MQNQSRKLSHLIRATHPIPCLAVSLFAGLVSFSFGIPVERSLVVFLAVLLQQISVGLSNDWLDYQRDLAANRTDKPAVTGNVTEGELRFWSLTAAVLAITTSLVLGVGASLAMLAMLVIGWAYNLGMKSNWSSVIPYALGFGTIPIFVGLAAPEAFWTPAWVVLAAALLGVSAHFANTLPDIEADKLTGVNALPHILGRRFSSLVIAGTAMGATLLVVTQSKALDPVLATTGLIATTILVGFASILSLKKRPPRIVFPLLILTSLVNVVLLTLGNLAQI